MTLLYSLTPTVTTDCKWVYLLILGLRNTNLNLNVKTSNKTTELFKIVKLMQVKLN